MEMSKYIIVEVRGCELPIVFHPIISHASIADGLTVVSAGFCEMGAKGTKNDSDNISVWVGGKSTTLKDSNDKYVVSREEDALIIQKMLREQN